MPIQLKLSDAQRDLNFANTVPGNVEAVLGGLAAGIGRDPIIGKIVDLAAPAFGGDSETLERYDSRIKQSGVGRAAANVAEFGTAVGLSIGAFGVGRAAVYGVARASAARLATGAAGKVLARQGAAVGARVAAEEALAAGVATTTRAPTITALERGAQILGGAAGEGTLQGAEEAARGGDFGDIAEAAAVGAALSGGTELGLTAAARFVPGLKSVASAPPDIDAARVSAGKAQAFLQGAVRAGDSKIMQLKDRLEAIVGVRELTEDVEQRLANQVANYKGAVAGARASGAAVGTDVKREIAQELGLVAPIEKVAQLKAELRRLRGEGEPITKVLRAQVARELGVPIDPRKALTQLNDARKAQANVGKLTRRNETLAMLDQGIDDIPDLLISRSGPLQVNSGFTRVIQTVLQRFVNAPEAAAAKLGLTTVKLVSDYADATALRESTAALVERDVLDVAKKLAIAAKRVVPKNLEEADTLLMDIGKLYEGVGADAVRSTFGNEIADALLDVSRVNVEIVTPFVQRSATRLQTAAELQARGTATYLPQVAKRIAETDEARVLAYLEAKLGDPAKAAQELIRLRKGAGTFGSLDYERTLPGTLADKIEAGLPFEGYFTGLARFRERIAQRTEFGKRFGYVDKEVNQFLALAQKAAIEEGANPVLVKTLLDDLFARNFDTQAGARLAKTITSAQTAMSLTFAVVPNLLQSGTTAVAMGLKNTYRGVRSAIKAEREDVVMRALAIQEGAELAAMKRIVGESAEDGVTLTDRVASASLLVTGFSVVERWNRLFAGFTTQATVLDTLARATTGRLRGPTLDAARRQFAELGLDLEAIAVGNRAGADKMLAGGASLPELVDAAMGTGAFMRAVVKGVNRSQSLPTRTTIPLAWQTPLGRVLTQFKSFAFGQGRLVRDRVLGEAAAGNIRPLMTMLAVYPIAGTAIAESVNALKDRKQDTRGITRFVENASMMGGFGLVQSAATATRFGRLPDFLLGPSASDALNAVEGSYRSLTNVALTPLMSVAMRKPVAQATSRLLGGAANAGAELAEYFTDDLDNGAEDFDSFVRKMRTPER